MNPLAHGLTPKMRPLSPRRSAVIAAVDIGTSKIACLIGRLTPKPPQEVLTRRSHSVEVIGIGHVRAAGMKAGAVVDLAAAENAVRHAVHCAERMAKVQIESVVVPLTAGRIGSELYAATVQLHRPVSDGDIERVLAAGNHHSVREGRVILHSLPISFSIDDTKGVREPRGMVGQKLSVEMHCATADLAPARNLMLTVEQCHLAVEAMVSAAYVSGLAVLADDEADLGAAVVDIGAGTTTIAVFSGGRFVHADGFALGGQHITMDVARGLTTSLADAERIKALHGSAISDSFDDRDTVAVPQVDEADHGGPNLVSRAALARIIKPRIEEMLEMVRDRLAASPFAGLPRGRVVLTGGGSQLTGLGELAARIFKRQVRLGRPLGISGLPEPAKGPAFATAAGLLVYPQAAYLEQFEPRRTRHLMTGTDGYFAKVGRWLRDGF